MHKIKFVNQKCDKSCVVACVAMIVDRPFDEVMKLFNRLPVRGIVTSAALAYYGYFERRAIHGDLFADKVYHLAVPSLNVKGVMHSVVVDTRVPELYDPQKGREGRAFYKYGDLKCWADVDEIFKAFDVLEGEENNE